MLEISAASKGFLKNRDMKRLNVIKENANKQDTIKNWISMILNVKFLWMRVNKYPKEMTKSIKMKFENTWAMM
jgi:hypothetical protein